MLVVDAVPASSLKGTRSNSQAKRRARAQASAPQANSMMTIDELARRTGITTRNIRAYHTKGLLPPPKLLGRTGYYEAAHVQRLRAVTRLLERGFSITSIRALLRDWEQGSTLSDALGFQEGFAGGQSSVLTHKQLAALFPGVQEQPELLARAVALGLFQVEGTVLSVPDPLLVEVGLKLTNAGVPLSAAVELFERLVVDLRPAAQRYYQMLRNYVGVSNKKVGRGSCQGLEDRFGTLVPLARIAVSSTFARELRALLTTAASTELPKKAKRSTGKSRLKGY